jgi:hypothetical protein
MHTLEIVLAWVGGGAGLAWLTAVPAFLVSHKRELQQIANTVDVAVSEVRTLRDEWNTETQTKG